ncbi:MAG TPA: hypothetical protein VLJ59_04915 [Mycobacteriales bacterium]|nr:hypothetical protein [Mycobacteriales bacterium]
MDERYDELLGSGRRKITPESRHLVVAATQRPSADIVPTSLRDLFGYRWAFRCSTDASSEVILGHGWLTADGGIPRRMNAARLSDEQVAVLADAEAVGWWRATTKPSSTLWLMSSTTVDVRHSAG